MLTIGKSQNGSNHREKPDDIGDRPFGHETAKDEHAHQGQCAADQREDGEKLLIEFQMVDHPPGRPWPGPRNGAEDEDHDRRPDQGELFVRLQLSHQPRHQEQDDGHRTGKDNLLAIGETAESDREREQDKGEAPAKNPPIGLRRFMRVVAHIHEALDVIAREALPEQCVCFCCRLSNQAIPDAKH